MSFRNTAIALVLLAAVAGAFFFWSKPRTERVEKQEEAKKELFTLDFDAVREIRIASAGPEIVLQKSGAEAWRVTAPFEDAADKYAVQGIISTARTTKADRVLESPDEPLATFGLAEPRIRVTYKTDEAEATLLVGDAHRIGSRLYVKRASDNDVLIVPQSVATALAKGPEDFRDKNVIRVAGEEARRIELVRGGRIQYVLTRAKAETPEGTDEGATPYAPDDRWIVSDGEAEYNADSQETRLVIEGLRGLRIERAIAGDAGELDEPAMELRVTFDEAGERVIRFGKAGDQLVRARTPDGLLVEVAASNVEKFDRTFADLRDRAVADFDPENVARVELRRGADTIILSRSSDGGFAAADGSALDSDVIAARLASLSDLRGTRRLEGDEKRRAERALASPELAIALTGTDEDIIARFDFARVPARGGKPEMLVARAGHRDDVFEIGQAFLADWPGSIDAWRLPEDSASADTNDEANAPGSVDTAPDDD
ncbi:DUF4340 domain-containing protein [bacterium]|nr:DUF4340 domain-containing protein [bacterium]